MALLFAGVGVVGMAPVMLLVVWLVRVRAAHRAGSDATRMLVSLVLAAVTLGTASAGAYVLLSSSPSAPASAEHDEHQPGATQPAPADAVPPTLAGLARTQMLTGTDAIRETEQLHGKQLGLDDAIVARYAGQRIEVWVSYVSDAQTASWMVDRMQTKIADGNGPFTPPVQVAPGVWATQGMGQEHWFFARSSQAWWLTADPELAPAMLAELVADVRWATKERG